MNEKGANNVHGTLNQDLGVAHDATRHLTSNGQRQRRLGPLHGLISSGEKGASRLDKLVFSYARKCHVLGEERPLAGSFPACQAPREQLRGGRKALLSPDHRTLIS
jgi:hypothetical protein